MLILINFANPAPFVIVPPKKQVGALHLCMARCYEAAGESAAALEALARALRIKRERLGAQHPEVGVRSEIKK